MASVDRRAGLGTRAWRILAANDTGIWTLLVLALLFVIGSIVRERAPGAYEGLQGDDIRFFFARVRPIDAWFWAILASCAFLGLSLACCTLDALRKRLRMRDRDPRAYGTILAHVGVGIALLAHAIGGWYGSETFALVGDRQTHVGEIQARLLGTQTRHYPDGAVRWQAGDFEVSRPGSAPARMRAAPNAPARWAGGTRMLILMRVQSMVGGAVLSIDGRTDTLSIGDERPLADGGRLVLDRLFGPPDYRVPIARVRVVGGPREGLHLLSRGIASDAPEIEMVDARLAEAAVVAYRRAPGTVWLLVGSIVFVMGIVLSAARRLQAARGRREGGVS
jgi:hypothetical protein